MNEDPISPDLQRAMTLLQKIADCQRQLLRMSPGTLQHIKERLRTVKGFITNRETAIRALHDKPVELQEMITSLADHLEQMQICLHQQTALKMRFSFDGASSTKNPVNRMAEKAASFLDCNELPQLASAIKRSTTLKALLVAFEQHLPPPLPTDSDTVIFLRYLKDTLEYAYGEDPKRFDPDLERWSPSEKEITNYVDNKALIDSIMARTDETYDEFLGSVTSPSATKPF